MNIENRTIYCNDNLNILRNIDSETIDMVYLDPPFNSKKSWHAPIGTSAEGASFKDIFGSNDIDPAWMLNWGSERPELYHFINAMYNFADLSDASYIQYMAVRVIEMQRILKDTGTLFYHCDYVMNDYVKIMLDIIFGRGNDINNIVWCYRTGGASKNHFGKKHDNIFWYKKSKNYTFNLIKEKSYLTSNGTGGGFAGGASFEQDEKGYYSWAFPRDYWIIDALGNTNKERTGYPTQKPLSLLRKIISCSTNEGDLILDPFCGCATTCVAAEQLNRNWVGIDISVKAYELVKERLLIDAASDLFTPREIHFQTSPPKPNNIKNELDNKYVYVISNPDLKGYKVGIATDAEKRLNSYQTGDPKRGYKIEFKIKTDKYKEIEKATHNHFDNQYEWVQAELKEIIKYIKNYEKTNI